MKKAHREVVHGCPGTASNTKASRRNLKLLQAIISSRSPTKAAQSQQTRLQSCQTGRQELRRKPNINDRGEGEGTPNAMPFFKAFQMTNFTFELF